MNEYIEIDFRKSSGQRLRVRRQVAGGIEFEEPDAIERTIGFQITGRNAATRFRMRRIAQVKGWELGQFKLKMSVEDGNIVLRGNDPDALPEGFYSLRVRVEELKAKQPTTGVEVEHDGHGTLRVDVQPDDRTVAVDLSSCDPEIRRVLEASTIDGQPAASWLTAPDWRPTRKACLLNLLASLRVAPAKSNPLLRHVREILRVFNDRVYAKVDSTLKTRIDELAQDDDRPFYAEGPPHAPIHQRLLDAIPAAERPRFAALYSYRGEGKPSLQMVVAEPSVGLPHTYAEFDLDLGNPLQDVLGFVVHVGELLDAKPTNHVDLRSTILCSLCSSSSP